MDQKTVMIVEDNSDIREIIAHILMGNDYTVELYSTASDFKNNLKQKLPDVIVLDIMLPDGDGIEMCKEIKSASQTGHIPILLMSANEPENEDCADGFIAKPFDIDLFKNKVEALL
jgi:two-component system phosphate regulon response regulator PhoB